MRGVNDVNDLHIINRLGTNHELLNVGNDIVRENEMRMNENLNVYVSVAGMHGDNNTNEHKMRGEQNEYERARVSVTQVEVHAALQLTGAPVNRSLSQFKPEVEVSRVPSVPAAISSVTYCTTTTTTALSFASRVRDDYLRMSATAYSRFITRDPNGAQPAYVTWHGQMNKSSERPRHRAFH